MKRDAITLPRARSRRLASITPFAALVPMALTAIVAYIGCALWTLRVSFTSSRTFASSQYVGLAQYERLFANERWVLSLHNLAVYGVLFIAACLVLGCLLAIFIDQNDRILDRVENGVGDFQRCYFRLFPALIVVHAASLRFEVLFASIKRLASAMTNSVSRDVMIAVRTSGAISPALRSKYQPTCFRAWRRPDSTP